MFVTQLDWDESSQDHLESLHGSQALHLPRRAKSISLYQSFLDPYVSDATFAPNHAAKN
jgi:hypothetical protein